MATMKLIVLHVIGFTEKQVPRSADLRERNEQQKRIERNRYATDGAIIAREK